jgi:hypothetical protein
LGFFFTYGGLRFADSIPPARQGVDFAAPVSRIKTVLDDPAQGVRNPHRRATNR